MHCLHSDLLQHGLTASGVALEGRLRAQADALEADRLKKEDEEKKVAGEPVLAFLRLCDHDVGFAVCVRVSTPVPHCAGVCLFALPGFSVCVLFVLNGITVLVSCCVC